MHIERHVSSCGCHQICQAVSIFKYVFIVLFFCVYKERDYIQMKKFHQLLLKGQKAFCGGRKIFTLGDLVFIFLLHLCWSTQIYLLSNIFALKNVLARYLKSTTNLFFYVQCDGECSTRLA